jgi:hypothetical protein
MITIALNFHFNCYEPCGLIGSTGDHPSPARH